MKREKTAVEWLTELLMNGYTIDNKIITQAKQMEKEQINHAYLIGFKDEYFKPNEYYESKYGKDE